MKKVFVVAMLLVFLSSCNVEKSNLQVVSEERNTDNIITREKQFEEKTIPEKEITSKEEAFENSGRAKEIEKESNLWVLYNNEEVGFSFKYPHDVILLKENMEKDKSKTYISVDLRDMGLGEGPMRLSKEDEMKNIEALSAGKFGVEQDFPLKSSEQTKSLGFLFAQDFMVLRRFDVCDVTLERKLLFYFNNKQITITLHGPVSELSKDYLVTDETNCPNQDIWNLKKEDDFNTSLTNGKANESIQKWYNLFDDIAETVVFYQK